MISYRFLFDATNSFRLGFYMMQRDYIVTITYAIVTKDVAVIPEALDNG